MHHQILLICSALKAKANMETKVKSSTMSTEVEMDTNQAYETVNLRYTSASGSQLQQRSAREEPVYESLAVT